MAKKKLTKAQVIEVLDRLRAAYPEAGCALDHCDPYELLVAVTLSAQTTDVSVNKVTPALFKAYPDVFAMAEADPADVAEIIRTIGLYKTKSQRIVEQAQALVEQYGGQVPDDQKKLQALPGVGQKTANVVMAEAFGHQRIAVDTHVFRVSNRIGLADAGDVFKTEEQLKKAIPEDRWTEAHHTIIFHGRRCCSARSPQCDTCPVVEICLKRGV
jgi:endonuclease-3